MKQLTKAEWVYIERTQHWFVFFMHLCLKYSSNPLDWKIFTWNLQINRALLNTMEHFENDDCLNEKIINEKDIKIIKQLVKQMDNVIFSFTNTKMNKRISINYGESLKNNYAYLDILDAGYTNQSHLCFITIENKTSCEEFENLFLNFIQSKTEREVETFSQFLIHKYEN